MRIAVIVTTYNRPDALAAVLDAYMTQSDRDFTVIVADDGSTDATRQVVADYRQRATFELHHVWQEDQGFRAAAVRNRAIAATADKYLIFTDGDCIPLPGFVAAHRALAEPGWFLSGNRVLLSRAFTSQVLQERLPIQQWGKADWLGARLRGRINRLLPVLGLPFPDALRRLQPRRWRGAKTCNLSAWRRDLLTVNGMDETYSGWGMEDSDLVIRLLHAGVKHKSARFTATMLHLWHSESDRAALPGNQQRLMQLLRSDQIRARRGLDQYS